MHRVWVSAWRNAICAVCLGVACGDDAVAVTEGGTGTSTGTTTDEPPPTTTVTPTTDTPTTDTPTTTLPTTTDSSTTAPVTTGDTTTGATTGDTTTGDTTGDSTTGGVEVVGKSVSQTVNGGTVATSANFRMVFTLGQPTSSQGTYKSANFRLQGGLVGANGSPP